MMKRMAVTAVLLVGITSATGCSWLFQDRLRGGYDRYTRRSEPQCTPTRVWAIGDSVFGGLNLLSLVLVAAEEAPVENRGAIVFGNAISAGVHIAAAVTGVSWARECDRAYADWDAADPLSVQEQRRMALLDLAGNPQNDPRRARAFWCVASSGDCFVDKTACTEDECSPQATAWCTRDEGRFVCNRTHAGCNAVRFAARSRRLGECDERRAGLAHLSEEPSRAAPAVVSANPPAAAPPPPVPAPATPRGFFCSSSAAKSIAGFCTREKADCQRARDAAIAVVTDLDECRLVEVAFCHVAAGRERCAPAMETCAQRAKSAAGVTAACEERQ